jgi:alpha-tubulin suppressor-like RCC1 family protein
MGSATPTANLGGTVKHISAGAVFYCGQLADDRIKCWGANESGQLGIGNTMDRGNKPNDMGANLPGVELGLPGGEVAVGLTTGAYHACMLTNMGRVKCWGSNEYGQLGLGDTQNRGDGPGEVSNAPTIDLGAGKKATAIAASQNSNCAILDTGELKCWGSGVFLGYGDNNNHRGDAPGEMGDALPPINLGAGLKPVQIDTNGWSSHFRCALLSNGRMKCWGYNLYGQLGVGSGVTLGDMIGEMGDNLQFVDLL